MSRTFDHHDLGSFTLRHTQRKPWSKVTKDGGTYHPFVDRNVNMYERTPSDSVDDHLLW